MHSLRAFTCIKGLAKASLVTKMSPTLISPMSRSLVYASRLNVGKHSLNCKCGSCNGSCSSLVSSVRAAHTNADKDLSVFLDKEIVLERNQVKQPKALNIPGYTVTEDGCNVNLLKKFQDEEITVRLNVNASVDPEDVNMPEGYNPETENPPIGEMKSRPDFTVEIKKRSGRTLVINCSYYRGPPEDEMDVNEDQHQEQRGQGDAFQIENFYIIEKGESTEDKNLRENIYMGDGELIDGEMYDLMMNLLDERGITNEFADRLVEYCTHYEHNQYIKLLSELKSFLAE